jgi:molybdate transport system substrate-binding protein
MTSDITIYCAGSLRMALNEAVGDRAELVPGPSGELRKRIENGKRPEIFISADMEHPRALQAIGVYGPVQLFTANRFCLILGPGLEADGRTVLDLLLNPELSLGTSTPKADPGGDYA